MTQTLAAPAGVATETAPAGQLRFVIVGTPRSGTTLMQRLVAELPGVGVPPETHFFRLFASGLLRRRRFPLDAAQLEEELGFYARLETSRGLHLDPARLVDDLGGRCRTAVELFQAIVRHLAPGATLCGEKTPSHLIWWRPLTRAMPELRVVALVRDPRAVISSYFAAWGTRPLAVLAERWALDQRLVTSACRELGAERCLVMRYEDLVTEPLAAQARVAELLSIRPPSGRRNSCRLPIHLPWETWKDRALEPVDPERVDAWRRELPPDAADQTVRIARREMAAFGYAELNGRRRPATRRLPSPRSSALRLRYRALRRAQLQRIARIAGDPAFA